MKHTYPSKVLITGGHEIGGVRSFAEGLRAGFTDLGIPVEIISPSHIFARWRELRDPRILKILSTSSVFAAPFARRAICMAHGVPRADSQGWRTVLAIIGSFKLANRCSGVQLVSVSHFTAATLRALFDITTDAVIHNPIKSLYLEPAPGSACQRRYITYVGRLISAKNFHRMIPAVQDLLDENPELRVCVVGGGDQRTQLETLTNGDSRFEFKGTPDDIGVRDWLRQTRVFVSGNEVEGFGIAYLEAMTQGCIVAMPGSGGGLEISPDNVGSSIQLLPLSWDRGEILMTLRKAINEPWKPVVTTSFTTKAVARHYLEADSRFSPGGIKERLHPALATTASAPVMHGAKLEE